VFWTIRRLADLRGEAPRIDHLRRAQRIDLGNEPAAKPAGVLAGEPDDVLRLMFLSCHPVLSTPAQVALTLRLIGGLTAAEIGRAFLVTEQVIRQWIAEAKRALTEQRVAFDLPQGAELVERLSSVLEVVYLIFNEDYTTTGPAGPWSNCRPPRRFSLSNPTSPASPPEWSARSGPHPDGADHTFEMRTFAPGVGVPEDPVCGSMNASVGQGLTGAAPTTYRVSQGKRLGRAGTVEITADPDGTVWVGGAATSHVQGTITL
jgi:hypothetical protein